MITSIIRTINPVMLIIALVFSLVGCPFLGFGLYEAGQTWHVLTTFKPAPGQVVDNTYSAGDNDSSGAYYPVVEFKPEDSKPVRFTDGVGTLPPDYEAGDPVEVLYNPNNTAEAYINSWKRLWFLAALFTGLGSIFVIIALLMIGLPWWQYQRR